MSFPSVISVSLCGPYGLRDTSYGATPRAQLAEIAIVGNVTGDIISVCHICFSVWPVRAEGYFIWCYS